MSTAAPTIDWSAVERLLRLPRKSLFTVPLVDNLIQLFTGDPHDTAITLAVFNIAHGLSGARFPIPPDYDAANVPAAVLEALNYPHPLTYVPSPPKVAAALVYGPPPGRDRGVYAQMLTRALRWRWHERERGTL